MSAATAVLLFGYFTQSEPQTRPEGVHGPTTPARELVPADTAFALCSADGSGAPTGLRADAVSDGETDLSRLFFTTSSVAGYRIDRSPSDSTGWMPVGTSATTKHSNIRPNTATRRYYQLHPCGGAEDQAAYRGMPTDTTEAGKETLGVYTRPDPAATVGSPAHVGLTNPRAVTTQSVANPYRPAGNESFTNKRFNGIVFQPRATSTVTLINCELVDCTLDTDPVRGQGGVDGGTINLTNCKVSGGFWSGARINPTNCHIRVTGKYDFATRLSEATWTHCYVEDNVFKGPYWDEGQGGNVHKDVVQWFRVPPPYDGDLNITFRGCRFDCHDGSETVAPPGAYSHNAALFNNGVGHRYPGLTVRDCWFKGSSYPLRVGPRNTVTNCIIEGWWSGGGPAAYPADEDFANLTWTDNRIRIRGRLEAFEKPPGTNSNRWGRP
jgi:hypothetical protein